MNQFRPTGTNVLLKVLPKTESESSIFLPDGKSRPGEIMRWEVLAIGTEVNDEKFSLRPGEVVILGGGHPGEGVWLVQGSIVVFDRRRIVAIEEKMEVQN